MVAAAGGLNSGLNLGSDNQLFSTGVRTIPCPLWQQIRPVVKHSGGPGLAGARPGLNVEFSILGDNNSVFLGSAFPPGGPGPAGNGPLAIAGAIAVDDQNLANGTEVKNTNFGIELRTPFNEQTATSVLAAGRTQGNLGPAQPQRGGQQPHAASQAAPYSRRSISSSRRPRSSATSSSRPSRSSATASTPSAAAPKPYGRYQQQQQQVTTSGVA